MKYNVYNTSGWSPGLIQHYWDDICGAFGKLARRFPVDATVNSLLRDAATGKKVLWLVLDEDDKFVALAMTQIRTNEATGQKIGVVMDLAGRDHRDIGNAVTEALENWARENGADWFAIEGRPGWDRHAKKHGFKPYAVMWRKKVE